jgi:hypothetical protein
MGLAEPSAPVSHDFSLKLAIAAVFHLASPPICASDIKGTPFFQTAVRFGATLI